MAVGGFEIQNLNSARVASPSKYDNKLMSTLKLDVHAVLASRF